jgi:hypothetical protein
MGAQYPKNDPNRLENLTEGLFNAFEALAKKEDFPPDRLLSAVANAAAIYAVNHGIDLERYMALQGALLLKMTAEKDTKK